VADVGKPGLRKLRTAQCGRDTDGGVFSLSKPTKGWPVGKYRLEIYVGDDLATNKTERQLVSKTGGNFSPPAENSW